MQIIRTNLGQFDQENECADKNGQIEWSLLNWADYLHPGQHHIEKYKRPTNCNVYNCPCHVILPTNWANKSERLSYLNQGVFPDFLISALISTVVNLHVS